MANPKSTLVGAFVLGGLGLAVAAILLTGGARLFASNLSAVVYFPDSVAGLAVGAPVTLRGVKVGTVRAMTVRMKLPELTPVIPVVLEIEPRQLSLTNGASGNSGTGLEAAIAAGLRARLVTQSLVTGQIAIDLDFHPDIPGRLSGEPDRLTEIPSMPSDLQRIKDEIGELKLAELADKARVALTAFERLTGELHGKLGPTLDSVQAAADAARVTLDTTTGAVRRLQADASLVLGGVDRLVARTSGQIASTGKEADWVLAAAARTLAKADRTIGALNDLTAAGAPMRGDVEAAVRDLAAGAASLRDLSRTLERDPGTVLFGRSSK